MDVTNHDDWQSITPNEPWARLGGLDEHIYELRVYAADETHPEDERKRAALIARAGTRPNTDRPWSLWSPDDIVWSVGWLPWRQDPSTTVALVVDHTILCPQIGYELIYTVALSIRNGRVAGTMVLSLLGRPKNLTRS